MARYSKQHKVDTRRRIVETSGRRFKSDGIDGSGVATLMGDAGLTNGAFYAHFDSKSDLVASVVADQLSSQVAAVEAAPLEVDAIEDFVRRYLSVTHRDAAGTGCPNAALLDEIGRCDLAVRDAYEDGAVRLLDAIADHLVDTRQLDADLAWTRAVGIFSTLVSTLQLARALSDPELSEEVLSAGVDSALALVPPVG